VEEQRFGMSGQAPALTIHLFIIQMGDLIGLACRSSGYNSHHKDIIETMRFILYEAFSGGEPDPKQYFKLLRYAFS
jgi:hypothetical protein